MNETTERATLLTRLQSPDELIRLKAQVEDLESTRQGLARIYEVNQVFLWKLCDLFEPGVHGVSPLHYLEEQITTQARQIAALKALVRELREQGRPEPCAKSPPGVTASRAASIKSYDAETERLIAATEQQPAKEQV